MRLTNNKTVLHSLFIAVVLGCGINSAVAAVSPWCGEPGDPTYPLSFEAMASGPLLAPEIRKSPQKAVQAISDAFDELQEDLDPIESTGTNAADIAAFQGILKRQIEGENLKSHFQFTEGDDGDQLFWPSDQRKLEFDCKKETPAQLVSNNPQKASIGYAAYLVFVILSEQLQDFDALYSDRVAERADEYMGFLSDGLPMWPWELAVNGWGQDYNDLFLEAPRWQWVVARPSAGFEVFWPNQKEAELEASLGIEPLGFVRYTGKGHKNWWGLSTLVVLGTDDNGAGLGGLIRYNNYSLGIVKREDIDDTYLYLSFDLYDKIEDTKTRISRAEDKLEQLKDSWNPQ